MPRSEQDQLGERTLLDDELYGIHSVRAFENFQLSKATTHESLIRALILVKKACAIANEKAKLMDNDKTTMIVKACDHILGHFDTYKDAFKTHPLQGGAGTSTNMNVNEVIANTALVLCDYEVGNYQLLHPVNHVNMSQSTNDVYPSSLKIASIYKVRELADALASLQEALQQKETEFASVLKLGRTQLMDALPVTLGQEFGSFARAISRDRWRIYKVEERLREINIGGTAVGTGMNAPLRYIYTVTSELQRLTGLGLSRSDLLMDSTQNLDVFVEVSGLLKALATNLIKISNDLRLMASGPVGGLFEINLEAKQAGSSIMPGKTNPVIPEMVNQVAFRIIGMDTTITMAASSGNLELNPYLPLIADELLNGLDLLIQAVNLFNHKCITSITANIDRCESLAISSYSLAAAFIDSLGYDKACEVAKEAFKKQTTIQSVLLDKQLLKKEDIDRILNIHQLTQPGIPGKR